MLVLVPPRVLVRPAREQPVPLPPASPPVHLQQVPPEQPHRSKSPASPEQPALPASAPAAPRHSPPSPADNVGAPSPDHRPPPAHSRQPSHLHLPSPPRDFQRQPRQTSAPLQYPSQSHAQSHQNTACTAHRCWSPQSVLPHSKPAGLNSAAREPQNTPAAACQPAAPDAAEDSETPRPKPSGQHSNPAASDELPQSSIDRGSSPDQ